MRGRTGKVALGGPELEDLEGWPEASGSMQMASRTRPGARTGWWTARAEHARACVVAVCAATWCCMLMCVRVLCFVRCRALVPTWCYECALFNALLRVYVRGVMHVHDARKHARICEGAAC